MKYQKDQIKNHLFYSSVMIDNCINNTNEVIYWLKEQNNNVKLNIRKTKLDNLGKWYFNEGRIVHQSGKFFTIEGLQISTNWGKIKEWDQPIIVQPEIGYLGFITKIINGVLYFLVQAKIEPGNINYVQLSPTLQATQSNYTQVHKGRKPLYLDYFHNVRSNHIIIDQLQSEQGGRFLKKRNRNIIILVEDEIPVYDNYIWLTLGQIKHLMQYNNLINMDTRTVISGISLINYDIKINELGNNIVDLNADHNKFNRKYYYSAISNDGLLHSMDEIIAFITRMKCEYYSKIERIPLNDMTNWHISDTEIYHDDNKYFKVIAVEVEIGNREVLKWKQPMIEPTQEGLYAFICKEINGVLHFAVQAKFECGNHDIIELAPTVQCLVSNYIDSKKSDLPFLDYVLSARKDQIIYDAKQSEEGGRFFREQNRNMIILGDNEIPLELPENYIWVSLGQLYSLIKFSNIINIQARSLISSILFN